MSAGLPTGFVGPQLMALGGIPEIRPGADLGGLIAARCSASAIALCDDDILVVAQKVVSKAENRFRALDQIFPSPRAHELAAICGKEPRRVQAVLDESVEVVRVAGNGRTGVLIARHRQGWVMANAGIDESNLGVEGQVLLLPENPDRSAAGLADRLQQLTGVRPGIIVTDTFGRPWRHGQLNVAIGISDVSPLIDWVGAPDAYGRRLEVTQQAFADEIAAASGLCMVKDALSPVVLVRGLRWVRSPNAKAIEYIRPLKEDLFK